MGLQFVHKYFPQRPAIIVAAPEEVKEEPKVAETAKPKNKKGKNNTAMNTMEQIAAAEAKVAEMAPEVKVVKKDRGLIERTESSKIILTEDNRQVLND